jgi:hypothetical protein
MNTPAIATVVRLMEALPESVQNQIVERLREYVDDMLAEDQWDELLPRLNRSSSLLLNVRSKKQYRVKANLLILANYEIRCSTVILGCLS